MQDIISDQYIKKINCQSVSCVQILAL